MSFNKQFFLVTTILSVIILVASYIGLNNPAIYAGETPNWVAQAEAQDIFDAWILAPILFISALFSFRGKIVAYPVWVGALMYTIYTYIIYAFTIKFGLLFPAYIAIIGMSFYLLLFSLLQQDIKKFKSRFSEHWIRNAVGFALVLFGGLFYFLWLSDVFSNIINNTVPQTIIDAGLITNPIHILDMALLLPAMLLSGWLLKQKNQYGYLFAPAVLTSASMFSLTILLINVEFISRGLSDDISLVWIFAMVLLIQLTLLGKYLFSFRD